MKWAEFVKEATMGGPGLDAYAFDAELLCEQCGEKAVRGVDKAFVRSLSGTEDPRFSDSQSVPQPVFFGESDRAEYCGNCGEYLYGSEYEETEGA